LSYDYSIIYADPPWSYADKALNRGGAERHYRTMSEQQIAALPIGTIAAKDAALFMWATFPKLREALATMDAWGFDYKTLAFTWIKTNRIAPSLFWGMGRWTRSNAEIVLLGTRGKPKRASAAVHSVISAPVGKHSAKPGEARDRIVQLMGDVPRVELFARERAAGWDAWGNEIDDPDLVIVDDVNEFSELQQPTEAAA
jgi:N6-adenosine-specific RNA methylase IME4